MKDNQKEITIIVDTLIILLSTLIRINRGEVTQLEAEELINGALGTLYPLMSRRMKEIERLVN